MTSTKDDGRANSLSNHERDTTTNANPEVEVAPEESYSVFTRREKWFVVALTSYAGVFSPLTSNIYFPAIPTLAEDFHKSTELINLTVTMYMVFQAISPMVFGTLADQLGRRPMFCGCLLILALTCVGLALVPTSAYWLLLLLRGIQAAGSASTIALGAGVIGDIAVRAERGGFYGLYGLGPMIGPAIGPVIGGGLADKLGWRSIFWFLCIGSGMCLVVLVLFLPETLRAIVGDGSAIPKSIVYRPVINVIGRITQSSQAVPKRGPIRFRNPFYLLRQPDVFLLLFFNGIIVAVFFGIVASISTIFHSTYPFLNETELGLCFLSIGGGMIVGSTATGRLLDWDFQRIKKNLEEISEKNGQIFRDDQFPIEQARLRLMPFFVVIYAFATIGYGWCIEQKVNIAGPLILLLAVGCVSISVMNTVQTILIDLAPGQSSSIAACNNLVRGSMGAALVAIIDIIINALGAGWTYVLLGGACAFFCPLLYIVIRIGPRCRAKRERERKD